MLVGIRWSILSVVSCFTLWTVSVVLLALLWGLDNAGEPWGYGIFFISGIVCGVLLVFFSWKTSEAICGAR
jgi:hypothetical protein